MPVPDEKLGATSHARHESLLASACALVDVWPIHLGRHPRAARSERDGKVSCERPRTNSRCGGLDFYRFPSSHWIGHPRDTAAQLAGLVSLMRSESADDHLGGRAMLNALSTAMFALVLRLASETEDTPRGLLALAGHPRLAPAVGALFNEPARAWSLPDLARLCNMSRATLARQFQEKLGRSPSDLLTDIRMTLAANELKRSSLSTGAVAEAVGYQSEAAFQRAFKGHMGITPAQWRKMQEPSGRDVFARPAATADSKRAETSEADPPLKRKSARGGDARSLA